MKKQNGTPFFTEEQKVVITKTLEGASELDVERFLITCERTGLDVFAKQIYGRVHNRKYKDKDGSWKFRKELVIITSIDGFLSIAERSGEYAGQTKPEWLYQDDEGVLGWRDFFIPRRDQKGRPITLPEACRVGIHRKGFVEPCYGYANFESFAVFEKGENNEWHLGTFWSRMPEHMIAKVAMASGLRKAFPLLVNGLFVEEEVVDEDQPIIAARPEEKLPDGAKWVPGHSPEERAARKEDPGLNPRPEPPQNTPASAPGAPPEPAKPAGKVETPKPTRKPATRQLPSERLGIPPTTPDVDSKADAADQLPGLDDWQNYKITQITLPAYSGRLLSDLTFDELETLKESWVERHAAKIAANPTKKVEAEQIISAFNARLDEKLKK
jgi:phage recombination protein Bet